MRDSFILYTDSIEHIEKLNYEQRGILFTALICSQRDSEIPEMDAVTDMLFGVIRKQIERDTRKYEETCERRREAGKTGGRPKANGFSENQTKAKKPNGFLENQTKAKKANGFSENQTKAKKPDTDTEPDTETDTDTDTETDTDVVNTLSGFQPSVADESATMGEDNAASNEFDAEGINETEGTDESTQRAKYPYKAVIDYLNAKTGSNYSPKSKDTIKHIRARFNEGYTLDDFKKVIDNTWESWHTDPHMVNYIRPATLFSGKFDNYLNMVSAKQSVNPKANPTKFSNFATRDNDYAAIERELLSRSMLGNTQEPDTTEDDAWTE